MIFSNNKLIVEAYKKEGLRSVEKSGFAFVDQKLGLKGLKVLVEANIVLGGGWFTIKKGSVAYFKEELLHTQAWAQKPLTCEIIGQPFLIVDPLFVDFFEKFEEVEKD